MTNFGGDEWIHQQLSKHKEKIKLKEERRLKDKIVVRFNRRKFTELVKSVLDGDVNDGFVIGLKKKQEFAMKLCGDYKKFTYPQKLQLVLALAVDLGLQDLSLMVKTLPSIPRTQLVLYVMAAALGFSVRNDPSISKNIKRGLVSVPEQFFLLVGAVPPGPKFLIRLRGDLKFLIKKYESTLSKDKVEALEYLDMVMRDLFATQASMRFRRIDMSSEKTVAYILRNERVHAVKNWEDLNRRIVGPNRHCFGLFHANMPNSPLVFVETILTNRLCSKVDEVLDTDLPPLVTPSHIIFYSISNTTSGLRGLNIASHLLFLSIEHLKGHFPSCNIFATLSPVPGFAAWFKSVLNHNHLSYFTPSQLQHLNLQFGVSHLQLGKWLLKRLESQRWYQDKILLEAIKDVLIAACCRYVLFERKGDKMSDPVANFHLQNGAQVEQVRFLADTSPSSMEKSCGLMINYRYSIPSIDQTSVSYKLTASAAVSYVSVRYVWHGSSLILDEIERLSKSRLLDIPLFARVHRPGDAICSRGTKAEAMYFISSGRVKVCATHPYMLDQNMHYGENEILRKEPVPYTLIAMTHTHVIVLMRNELENLLKKSQALQDSLRFSNFDGKTQLENGQETHSRL